MDPQTLYIVLAVLIAAGLHLFVLCRLIGKVADSATEKLVSQAAQRDVRLFKSLQDLAANLSSVSSQLRTIDQNLTQQSGDVIKTLDLNCKALSDSIHLSGKNQRDESKEVAKEVRSSSESLEKAISGMAEQLRGFKEGMADLAYSNRQIRDGMAKLATDLESTNSESSEKVKQSLDSLNKVLIEATKL
jgi:predicted RNase H-like nuclease (RuvC/YqgF family)